jgi:hypothetical protein
MSLPALPTSADTRSITDRVNVLIRELNAESAAPVAIASGTLQLDLRVARAFRVTVNADFALLSIANAAAGAINVCLVEFTGNGTAYSQTWTGVTWLTGAPVLSSTAGKRDLLGLLSLDGGTWLGIVIGQAY